MHIFWDFTQNLRKSEFYLCRRVCSVCEVLQVWFSVVLIPRRESTEKLEEFVLRDEARIVSSSSFLTSHFNSLCSSTRIFIFFSLSSSTNLWIPKYVEPETIYFNLQECIFFKIVCFCPFIKKRMWPWLQESSP